MSTSIVLFTRDLRIHDNPALHAASRADSLVAVFVRDPRITPRATRRAAFLDGALAALDAQLRSIGARLTVVDGPPEAPLARIADLVDAGEVHIAADVSPFAKRRERAIQSALGRRPLITHAGVTVVEPGRVAPAGRTHYRVFTPYYHAWLAAPRRPLLQAPKHLRVADAAPASAVIHATAHGEPQARARLDAWLRDGLARYATTRDALAIDGTSHLSAALHLGLISPLEVAHRAADDAFRRQLAWRDFYHQLLDANPHTVRDDLVSARAAWTDDPDGLAAWRAGETGYPLVDAAMRQLAAEGWMHNRARMVVASFLTKHLNIDWRSGARVFDELLVDGDIANNIGGWQSAAGTGSHAHPGRIFNPVLQGQRFDPSGAYTRRWVSELAAEPPATIHETGARLGAYCRPIVDHATATLAHRERSRSRA